MIRSILTLSCILILSLPFRAVLAQQVFKTTSKSVIGYLQYLPDGYHSNSKDYPVLIFLHGRGEKGPNSTDPKKLQEGERLLVKLGPPMHVNRGTKFPFILISPQLKSNYSGWPTSYVLEVIEHVQKTLRIDKNRIYITGLSMGGYGTWAMIQQYPHLFAAAAPVCGGGNTSKAKAIADEDVAVWAFHGDADNVVPVSASINMVNAINRYNPDPRARIAIYGGVKHDAWGKAYKPDHSVHNPNVYEWMMAQRNKPAQNTPENKAPVVNAGPDQTIDTSVKKHVVAGSARDADGSIVSYEWSKVSGGAITLANAASKELTISGFEEGSYLFRLTVTDNKGATGFDETKITVKPASNPPVANAGEDKTIQLPRNSVVLRGEGKSEDSKITGYEWTMVSGRNAELSGEKTQELTANELEEGEYVFRLKVKAENGLSDTDDVTVKVKKASVNRVPVADAGDDQTVDAGAESFVLEGSGEDADGSIAAYEWSKVSGGSVHMSGRDKAKLTVSEFGEGVYVFRLKVTDDKGGHGTDEVRVTVKDAPKAPVANAGADKVIRLPENSVVLKGEGRSQDSDIVSYEWSKVSGGSASLSGDDTAELTLNELQEGEYVFRLKVTNDNGLSDTDDVRVTAVKEDKNQPPVANAGPDRSVDTTVKSLALSGSGSDPDGTIKTFRWKKVSGGDVVMADAETKEMTITGFEPGAYVFRLTVEDDDGAKGSDDVRVIVKEEESATRPVVNAGLDRSLRLPENKTTLSATASIENGEIVGYEWSKVSGDETVLTGHNTHRLTVSDLKEGVYVFRVKVISDKGLSATDEVTVTVLKKIANRPPVASAGPDQVIGSTAGRAVFYGWGTDQDGSIASYSWTRVAGEACLLADIDEPVLTVTELEPGVYVFRLTVKDDQGAMHSDDVTLEVKTPENDIAADAGPDVDIPMGTANVVLKGGGYSGYGDIVVYQWTQVSGLPLTVDNAYTPELAISGITTAGIRSFRLLVRDETGREAVDHVRVIIEPSFLESVTDDSLEVSAGKPDMEERSALSEIDLTAGRMPHADKFDVAVFNDRGERIFTGTWDENSYQQVFNNPGFYVYHILAGGRRIKSGKIIIQEP